jgi:glycerophosphoryl diester phosphodiesterase
MVKIQIALALALIATAAAQSSPLIIAHRGASGYRPEHTLEAYRLAVEMGADYIEPDLVSTKDGVLIARHENEIGGTTDVADKFPERRQTKTLDGRTTTGWFSGDFTLAEIKTLRARERLATRSHVYDGEFQVPTFDEVIELAQQLGRQRGRSVGVYPETKHPMYFRRIKLALEEPLLASLGKYGWNQVDAPVFIQSFEADSLRSLRPKTTVRLIQLVSNLEMLEGSRLKSIATYAQGIGADKQLVVPVNTQGVPGQPTDLVARAHALGLLVHVWTLRIDKEYLPAGYRGNAAAEFKRFRDIGVDGLFTDFPDVAVKALAPVG